MTTRVLIILIQDNYRGLKQATQVDACVLAFLRNNATGIRNHTQVELLWITRRIRRISAFPINSERLDASVFTSTLPEIGRNSRTISTRATDVIFERKHCSRRRRHTQVDITSPHKQLGNSETIDVVAGTVPESPKQGRKVDLWPALTLHAFEDIGLYRDVWIAAIASPRTRVTTLSGVMCNTSQ